jgi:glycosyltransferase involved in cell wall biosynthesis
MRTKNKNIIWVNTLVKNEERWIWFALKSVLPYVDKILVWDSGSTDKTESIIKGIKSPKIIFREIGYVSKKDYGQIRQKMLKETDSDWVWILDGDEIWPKNCADFLMKEINAASKNLDTFCVKPINFVSDTNYIHPEVFCGQTPYGPKGLKGFYSTRVFRLSIPGLYAGGPYGKETFYDKSGKTLIENKNRVKFLIKTYYWHMSYLPRSSSRKKDLGVIMRWRKRKYEIGIPRPKWIEIPTVFYLQRPRIVPDPFYKMNRLEFMKAILQTPLKNIKRKIIGWKKN